MDKPLLNAPALDASSTTASVCTSAGSELAVREAGFANPVAVNVAGVVIEIPCTIPPTIGDGGVAGACSAQRTAKPPASKTSPETFLEPVPLTTCMVRQPSAAS